MRIRQRNLPGGFFVIITKILFVYGIVEERRKKKENPYTKNKQVPT
jgi:hypothetical protein